MVVSMGNLSFQLGQPVYTFRNEGIRVDVTVQNACVMPNYRISKEKEICPYWLAPWWNDRLYDDGSTISSTLRGNFFCMEREGDGKHEHGLCANSPWELYGLESDNRATRMRLRFSDPIDGGMIEKTMELRENDTAVYECDRLSGFEGRFSYNTHPCLKMPKTCFSAQLEGTFHSAITCANIADTQGGTYRRLPASLQIDDLHNVTTIYGEKTDLTRHPQHKGTIDLLLSKTEAVNGIGYAVLMNPEEGYLYYQLKNADVLPYTMLWIFCGGRHFAPWNGTVDGCLGVEEMSAPVCIFDKDFGQGTPRSYTRLFQKTDTLSVKQIYGAVALPDGFTVIEKTNLGDHGLEIVAGDGLTVQIPVDLSFLMQE